VKVWDLEAVRADPATGRGTSPLSAIAPFDEIRARQHQQSCADHLGTPVETTNSIGMKLRLVPAGEYTMGSPASENDRDEDEFPQRVTLAKSFYLGVTEVTQEQYRRVLEVNPSRFKCPQNPVESVSWKDAVQFCRKLSAMPAEKSAGHQYRLPTEAEWEYACRAGTTTAYGFGDETSRLGDYGWFAANAGGSTHPVGMKKPNAFGLYDMHGNVFEWCSCMYGTYSGGDVTDPTGPMLGSGRVIRGGGCLNSHGDCRSACRNWSTSGYRESDLGFRVLRSSIK
jgi:formylglycine-generating enzyme required for sulfatase activity